MIHLQHSLFIRGKDHPFEWYQNYSSIRHFFTNTYLSNQLELAPPQKEKRVLVIGCGNSQLSEEMKEDFENVISVDFSPVVIRQMQDKYGAESNYHVLDVTKSFPYPENSFDIIVCKGTMDSILCGVGSLKNIRNTMMECSRVLKDELGALVIITYGSPVDRMLYIEDEAFGWTIDVYTVPKPRIAGYDLDETKSSGRDHYVYICKKGSITTSKSGEDLRVQDVEPIESTPPNTAKQPTQMEESIQEMS